MPSIEDINAASNIADDAETYTTPTVIKKIKTNKYLSLSNLKDQLGENNWADWSRRLTLVLEVCKVWEYVSGLIPQPNKQLKLTSANNWTLNDNLAKLLNLQNISKSQLQHINQKQTLAKVWESITYLHQAMRFHTGLTYMRKLYNTPDCHK